MKFLLFILLSLHNPFDWSINRKLQWSDFQGKWKGEALSASICTGLTLLESKDSLGGVMFKVTASCDPSKSFIAPNCSKSDYALKHEQGHFDIAEIWARIITQRMASIQHTYRQSDLQVAIAIYNFGIEKWGDMDRQYDSETENGFITKEQQSWNQFIADKLKQN